MDPNDLLRNLWEHRKPVALSVSTLVAALWIFCGVTFEEPFAFHVGVAILTPLLVYGSIVLGNAIPRLRKAPALTPTPPEAPNP